MFDFDILVLPSELIESLLALAICALLILRAVVHFAFSKAEVGWSRRRVVTEGFFWFSGVLLFCFFAGDLSRVLVRRLDPSMMIGLSLISAIGILAFAIVGFAARFGSSYLGKQASFVTRLTHFLVLVGVGVWFSCRMYQPGTQHLNEIPLDSHTLMSEDTEYLAITDAGTQIPLYEIDIRESNGLVRNQLANSTMIPAGAKVIPRGDANLNANCHGWVFTGGKFLLRGRSVDQILTENGYTVQGIPAAGDVIVYRGGQGELLHTGIVSGILLDGTCIIESKWGIAGRYLHQAEDQPYGLNYAFYRSERGGHLVTVIHRKDAESYLAKAPAPSGGNESSEISTSSTSNRTEEGLETSLSD